jgi:hypothetical protein
MQVNRWLSVRLEMVGIFVVFGTAVFATVLLRRSAGIAGLAITSALNLTGLLNWFVRVSSELEVGFASQLLTSPLLCWYCIQGLHRWYCLVGCLQCWWSSSFQNVDSMLPTGAFRKVVPLMAKDMVGLSLASLVQLVVTARLRSQPVLGCDRKATSERRT